MPNRFALRGRLLWFVDDPESAGEAAMRHIADGLIVLEAGRIAAAGSAEALLPTLPAGARVVDHRPHLLMPGFIDAHIHLPQTQVIASYGAKLLDWLERHTFVEERKFGDPAHAARIAGFFCDELARCGTTTAVVYGSVHPASVEALFAEAGRRGLRLIAGKVMMDRNAPEALRDSARRGYDETKALIGRWHGQGRLGVAISPRFAITSSEAQLEAAGALLREHPDCWLQTHLSENRAEIETVRRLFPKDGDYTAVYERFGLLGPRSLFGHCIHLDGREWRALSESRSIAVSCPTANLFLGSGLFDRQAARAPERPVRVALGTDVGAGTTYSMLRVMGEAYKVAHLQDDSLSPRAAFHWATRGNANALGLGDRIGAFAPGLEGDVIVLDARATPAMAHRMETADSLDDELFVLATLGDERAIVETYVLGQPAKPR